MSLYRSCRRVRYFRPAKSVDRVLVSRQDVVNGRVVDSVDSEVLDTLPLVKGLKAFDFSVDAAILSGNVDLLKPVAAIPVSDFAAADNVDAAAAIVEE